MSRSEQEYTFKNGDDILIVNAYTFEGAVEGLIECVKNPLNWKEIDCSYDDLVTVINKIQNPKHEFDDDDYNRI